MKTFYMTLAAVSALAVTAPAAAQKQSQYRPTPPSWDNSRQDTRQLQMRFDAGVQTGAISRREAMGLRAQLRQLTQLERQYSRAGFNPWERRTLRERSRTLNINLMAAERSGNGPFGRGDRFDDKDRSGSHERWEGYSQADHRDMRGDRFNGDVRIGQRFSDRQVALPMEFRSRFQDSDASYYRYDEDRIYQIDRRTGLIMAMFTIDN
jgi:hypothetical protein